MADEPKTPETPITREAANEAAYERLKDKAPKSDSEIIARQADEAAAPEPEKKNAVRAKGPDGRFLPKDKQDTPPPKPDADFGWEDDKDDPEAGKAGDDADPEGKPEPQEWLDDDLRADAAALRMTDEELVEYGSREELERTLRILTRNALAAVKSSGDEDASTDEEAEKAKAKAEKNGKAKKADPPKPPADDDLDLDLDPEEFTEDFLKKWGKVKERIAGVKALEERVAAIEQDSQNREAAADVQRFDEMLDTLGLAELVGTTGKETKDQHALRESIYRHRNALLDLGTRSGAPFQDGPALLRRVLMAERPEFFLNQQRKELTKRISKQHDKILGSGSFRAGTSKGDPYEKAERRRAQLESAR